MAALTLVALQLSHPVATALPHKHTHDTATASGMRCAVDHLAHLLSVVVFKPSERFRCCVVSSCPPHFELERDTESSLLAGSSAAYERRKLTRPPHQQQRGAFKCSLEALTASMRSRGLGVTTGLGSRSNHCLRNDAFSLSFLCEFSSYAPTNGCKLLVCCRSFECAIVY